MIDLILVPTDFSQCAEAALHTALPLAKRLRARLHLLHVHDTPHEMQAIPILPPGQAPMPFLNYIEQSARQRMDALLARLSREVAVEGEVIGGLVDQEVVRAARRLDADLIIMGTHGRRGWSRLFLGSVAEQVVRHAPCPVMTIRSEINHGD